MTDNEARSRAVNSPEYKAALIAQLDFDSTKPGQRELQAAIASSTDKRTRRGLNARYVAGVAASRFRKEQAALMPSGRAPARKDANFGAHRALAQAREDLARQLGWAAAHADAFGVLQPTVREELVHFAAVVRDADRDRCGEDFVPGTHAVTLVADDGSHAPWAQTNYQVPAIPSDVGVLATLGVTATWDAERGEVLTTGDFSAAARWGYQLSPEALGDVVTTGPDIVKFLARRDAKG